MPSRNYIKGRRYEYTVRDFLRRLGFHVVRAAGSHEIDLVACKGYTILFIEVKTSGFLRRGQLDLMKTVLHDTDGEGYLFTKHSSGRMRIVQISNKGKYEDISVSEFIDIYK